MTNIMIFSPHPDDAELCLGGFILNHIRKYKVTIINLTNGDYSTNGTSETRKKECLEIEKKYNNLSYIFLNIKDLSINHNDVVQQKKIINIIRSLKPSIICSTSIFDRHPDHYEAAILIRKSIEMAGTAIYTRELGEPYSCKYLLLYNKELMVHNSQKSIYINTSEVHEEKLELLCYFKSQLSKKHEQVQTKLNKWYLKELEAKERYCGSLIYENFAEQVILEKGSISVDNIFTLLY